MILHLQQQPFVTGAQIQFRQKTIFLSCLDSILKNSARSQVQNLQRTLYTIKYLQVWSALKTLITLSGMSIV